MSDNKYEQSLRRAAAGFDAMVGSDGRASESVRQIVEDGDKEAAQDLCKQIAKALEQEDMRVTHMASLLKDSLILYFGHKELHDICDPCQDDANGQEQSLEDLLAELDSLVGLRRVKEKVKDLLAYQKVQLRRKEAGLTVPHSTMHLSFTGSPGTGKTTVARIVGKLYKKLGLLSKGHFMEVSRTDLIAGYQGRPL